MGSYLNTTYEYTKLRKTYGRQPLFTAVPGQMLDSIMPCKEDQKFYGLRNPVHNSVQAVNSMSENEVNTPLLETREQGINHVEGGWPRDIHADHDEQTARHRRRVQHEEGYCGTVLSLAPTMMHYIDQNNAIEMYQTYFSNIPPMEPIEKYSIRVANAFHEKNKKPISCIEFTNEKNPKLVVAYSYKTCMPDLEVNNTNYCYFWDVHRHTSPAHEIHPEYPCWDLACSPITPELVLCGLENGTVNVFDIRASEKAVSTSFVHNSHRESVTSLRYIQSRTHTEFFSGSSDGQCLWWDLRNLSSPLDQLPMCLKTPSQEINPSNAEGVSFLEFDFGLPTKYLCGTESGLIINVNRMGKSHSEKLVSYWNAHNGPVQTIQRSKCTLRMFLSCGDYTVRIWSEEVRTAPIIVSEPYKHLVTDACWAPTKFSCYMSICAGGYFYFWDLLRKYKEPIKSLNVSEYALTKMSPYRNGKLVAVGDSNGTAYLLELSENMATAGNRDKLLMHQTYERETKREHILDNRLKEIRLKARTEEENSTEISETVTINDEELDQATEDEYFRIVNEELKSMDLYNSSEQAAD